MSPDEEFLTTLLKALNASGVEAIIVGNAGAALQGAPVTTQDVDLLVRDTPLNREKLETLSRALGAARPAAISELTTAVRITGAAFPIDILFDSMSGGLQSLDDIIRSKEAAGRPKDTAVLPILRDTLRVQQALDQSGGETPT